MYNINVNSTVLLALRVRSSAIFPNVFTFVNITIVIFVIIGDSINGKEEF